MYLKRAKISEIYYITPDGFNLRLDNTTHRVVRSISGTGAAPINYVQDNLVEGNIIRTSSVGSRLIDIIYSERTDLFRRDINENYTQLNEIKEKLAAYMMPRQWQALYSGIPNFNVVPGKLRIVREDGQIRQIDVLPVEGPKFEPKNSSQWDEWSFTESLRFISVGRPYFYSPKTNVLESTNSIESNLVFPDIFPIEFNNSFFIDELNLEYNGNIPTAPFIKIYGPIESPSIYNKTTGVYIKLNHRIEGGSSVTFDLEKNPKVLSSDGINLLGLVSDPANIFDFVLVPSSIRNSNINTMVLEGAGAVLNMTKFVIKWKEFFAGV